MADSVLLRPDEMLMKFTHRWNGLVGGWAVMRNPDGTDLRIETGVHRTKAEALHQATTFYVSHLARHGLPWDAEISEEYRGQYDAFFDHYAELRPAPALTEAA